MRIWTPAKNFSNLYTKRFLGYVLYGKIKGEAVTAEPPKRKSLDRVRNVCIKYCSYRTEQSYVQWICRFILFHNKRHPREMRVTVQGCG